MFWRHFFWLHARPLRHAENASIHKIAGVALLFTGHVRGDGSAPPPAQARYADGCSHGLAGLVIFDSVGA